MEDYRTRIIKKRIREILSSQTKMDLYCMEHGIDSLEAYKRLLHVLETL